MPQNNDITALLEPGETLLWHGRPDVDRLVGRKLGGIFITGAGVGLLLLWAWYAVTRGSVMGPFVALMFLAFAAALAYGRFREVRDARTSRYAVTDRRALIASGRAMENIRTFAPDEIGPFEVRNEVRGVGDLLFHHVTRITQFGSRRTESDGFIGIGDIGKAREALLALSPKAASRQKAPLAPDVSMD